MFLSINRLIPQLLYGFLLLVLAGTAGAQGIKLQNVDGFVTACSAEARDSDPGYRATPACGVGSPGSKPTTRFETASWKNCRLDPTGGLGRSPALASNFSYQESECKTQLGFNGSWGTNLGRMRQGYSCRRVCGRDCNIGL